MVKVELLCVIFVLVFASNSATTNSNNSTDSFPRDEKNSLSMTLDTIQTINTSHGISPLNNDTGRMKQIKEEVREYYHNLRNKKNLLNNMSNIQKISSLLNEQGKPIHKAVCSIIKYDYIKEYTPFDIQPQCANKLRRNPFLKNAKSIQCFFWRSSKGGFSLLTPSIKIVSDTELGNQILLTDTNVKNQTEPGNCTIVVFYARWCNMSARAAPHFNAIPRGFENIRFVAVDTYAHPEVISSFVIYAVPTLLLFHNGRIQARFTNESFDISSITDFLEKYTDQKFRFVHLESSDYDGPIPSVVLPRFKRGELIMIAWTFILFSCIYGLFSKPAFNLFLKLIFQAQTILEDVEFKD